MTLPSKNKTEPAAGEMGKGMKKRARGWYAGGDDGDVALQPENFISRSTMNTRPYGKKLTRPTVMVERYYLTVMLDRNIQTASVSYMIRHLHSNEWICLFGLL